LEGEGALVVALGLVEQGDLVVHQAEFFGLAAGCAAGGEGLGVRDEVAQQRPGIRVGVGVEGDGLVDPVQCGVAGGGGRRNIRGRSSMNKAELKCKLGR
jgi:hypothetical protein